LGGSFTGKPPEPDKESLRPSDLVEQEISEIDDWPRVIFRLDIAGVEHQALTEFPNRAIEQIFVVLCASEVIQGFRIFSIKSSDRSALYLHL